MAADTTNEFARRLKSIRLRTGARSARAFFNELSEGRRLTFNYSYYVRIEKGLTLPSAQVVSTLAELVGETDAAALVQAYCQTLFPRFSSVFGHYREPAVDGASDPSSDRAEGPLVTTQSELSRTQVAVIGSDRDTYHVFLIATLARKPFPIDRLGEVLRGDPLVAVRKLEAAKLISMKGNELSATAVEARFPKATDKATKEIYERLDEWDDEFGTRFDMEALVHKLLLRRISPRYLSLIRSQLENLFDLIKASDETDTKYNDEVVHLRVTLRRGRLPG